MTHVSVRPDQVFAVLLLGLAVLVLGGSGAWFSRGEEQASILGIELNQAGKIPILSSRDDQTSELDQLLKEAAPQAGAELAAVSAKAIYIIDPVSNTILLEKNAHQPLPPASTTKLMTALVALDVYSPKQVLAIKPRDIALSNKLEFIAGEELAVEDLVLAMLVESSNESAEVLANNHPDGRTAFITAMNLKADQLGLENTSYTNPTGYDDPGQWSTARDLSVLGRRVMAEPELRPIVGLHEGQITDFFGKFQHQLNSTNQLLSNATFRVVGIKTGTTNQAGEVLISQLEFEDKQLQIVVLGSQDRYADTLALVDWTLSNYQWRPLAEVLSRDDILGAL